MKVVRDASTPVQERAWGTRKRILDAAVSCLVELGYAGTTTAKIQARSGVSRGSLLHQFPAKDQLLIAAVQHLAVARRVDLVEQGDRHTAAAGNAIDGAIETLWATMQGPLFAATTELWIAARTNHELRQVLQLVELNLGRQVRDIWALPFGEHYAASPKFGELRSLLLSSMRGVALTYTFAPRDPQTDPHLPGWKRVAHLYLDGDR